jgi:cell wall-associated NlpC family hydrolase
MQDTIAAAARDLIGVRFRPQGRDPAYGLDCVGVVAVAMARAGCPVAVPGDYAQRGGDPNRIARALGTAGLRRIDDGIRRPGDILLMQAGPLQLHLAVQTVDGTVHADAALRRIVEAPGAPRWPVLGIWRIEEAG